MSVDTVEQAPPAIERASGRDTGRETSPAYLHRRTDRRRRCAAADRSCLDHWQRPVRAVRRVRRGAAADGVGAWLRTVAGLRVALPARRRSATCPAG